MLDYARVDSEYYNSEHTTEVWTYYDTPTTVPISKYKIHISILPDDLDKVQDQIHDILHLAIQRGLIYCYKNYNIQSVLKLFEEKIFRESSRPSAEREMHYPFVIYLNDVCSDQYLLDIAGLCEAIEKVLVGIKPGEISKRAACDLPLTPHIVFRQAYADGAGKKHKDYVPSYDTERNKLLIEQCKQSKPYQTLLQLLPMHALRAFYTSEMAHLMKTLEDFAILLRQQKELLQIKHGATNEKVRLFEKKILEVERQIFIAHAELMNSHERPDEYKSYAEAESVLMPRLLEIRTEAIGTMAFIPSDENVLTAHQSKGAKGSFMKKVGISANTQSYFNKADPLIEGLKQQELPIQQLVKKQGNKTKP